jgi:hypothetical protein
LRFTTQPLFYVRAIRNNKKRSESRCAIG